MLNLNRFQEALKARREILLYRCGVTCQKSLPRGVIYGPCKSKLRQSVAELLLDGDDDDDDDDDVDGDDDGDDDGGDGDCDGDDDDSDGDEDGDEDDGGGEKNITTINDDVF
jgi:hypothetical protein